MNVWLCLWFGNSHLLSVCRQVEGALLLLSWSAMDTVPRLMVVFLEIVFDQQEKAKSLLWNQWKANPQMSGTAFLFFIWRIKFMKSRQNNRILVYNLKVKTKRHIYIHFPKAYKRNLAFKVKCIWNKLEKLVILRYI